MDPNKKNHISELKRMLQNVKKVESPNLLELKYYIHVLEVLLLNTEKHADCSARTALQWIEEINNFTKKLSKDILQYLYDAGFPRITICLCKFVSIKNKSPIYYETIFKTWMALLQFLPTEAYRNALIGNAINIRAIIKCLDYCDDFMQQKQIIHIFLIYVNASPYPKYLCELILQQKKMQQPWKLLIGQGIGKKTPTHLTYRNVINVLNKENNSSTLYSIEVSQIYFDEQPKIKEDDQYFWMDFSVKQGKISLTYNDKMSDQNANMFTQFSVRIQDISSINLNVLTNGMKITIKLKADVVAGNDTHEGNIQQITVIFTKDALANLANMQIRLNHQLKKGDKTLFNEILAILNCLVTMTNGSIVQEQKFMFDNVKYQNGHNNIDEKCVTNLNGKVTHTIISPEKTTQEFISREKNRPNPIEDFQQPATSNLQCRSFSENNKDNGSSDGAYFSDTEELNNLTSLYMQTGAALGLEKKSEMTFNKDTFQKIKSIIKRSTLTKPQLISGSNIDPYDIRTQQPDNEQPKKRQGHTKNQKETVLKKTKVVVNRSTNSKKSTRTTTRARKTVKYVYSSSDSDIESNNSNDNRQIGNKYKSLTASRPQFVDRKKIRLTQSSETSMPSTSNRRNQENNANQQNDFIKTAENSPARRRSISKNILENEEDQSVPNYRTGRTNVAISKPLTSNLQSQTINSNKQTDSTNGIKNTNFKKQDQPIQKYGIIDRVKHFNMTLIPAQNLKNISNASTSLNITDFMKNSDCNNDIELFKTNKDLNNKADQRSESVQSVISVPESDISVQTINTYLTPTNTRSSVTNSKKKINFDLPNKSKSSESHVTNDDFGNPREYTSNIPSLSSFNIIETNLLTSPIKPTNELRIMLTKFENREKQKHGGNLSIQPLPTPLPTELPRPSSTQPRKTSTQIVEYTSSQSSMLWASEDYFADGYSTDTDSRKSNNIDILKTCDSGPQLLTQEVLKNHAELNSGQTLNVNDENQSQFENEFKKTPNEFHEFANDYHLMCKQQMDNFKNNENSWKIINEQFTELKQKLKCLATFTGDLIKLKMLHEKRDEQHTLNMREKVKKLENHLNAYKHELFKQMLEKIGKELSHEIMNTLPEND